MLLTFAFGRTARRLHRLPVHCLLVSLLPGMLGCSTTAAIRIAGATADAAMEAAGLRKSAARPDPEAPRPLSVTLSTGRATNAAPDGEPLALVVRIYLLRSDTAFARLTYQQSSDPEAERLTLQTDLVAVREMTLIPGRTYRFDEQVPGDVKVIGVAAQFHKPAANRWKLAFDREASEKTGISIALHACAMTAGSGELTPPAVTASSRSLSGVRCT